MVSQTAENIVQGGASRDYGPEFIAIIQEVMRAQLRGLSYEGNEKELDSRCIFEGKASRIC